MMLARLQTRNAFRAVKLMHRTQPYMASSHSKRSMSIQTTSTSKITGTKTTSSETTNKLMSVWPMVKQDLIEFTMKNDIDPATTNRFAEALEYNVPHGKKGRAALVVNTYKALMNSYDENDLKLACVMGWCAELVNAIVLLQDDILDGSTTRRKRPCWYKVDGVGMFAFNDSMMMHTSLFLLLKKYFGGKDYYTNTCEIINEIMFYTYLGQSLDVTANQQSVESFTLEKYTAISKYKAFYYTFYLPVALGMHITGKMDLTHLPKLQEILFDTSDIIQIQNDYKDIFVDPKITGKVGTDIQDNACTWLPAIFNQKATLEQKEILKECYGSQDPVKIARAKQLFVDVGLVDQFKTYEANAVRNIMLKIKECHELPPEVLQKIVQPLIDVYSVGSQNDQNLI